MCVLPGWQRFIARFMLLSRVLPRPAFANGPVRSKNANWNAVGLSFFRLPLFPVGVFSFAAQICPIRDHPNQFLKLLNNIWRVEIK